MKIAKSIFGIVLILCALGGLVLWETKGRENVMTSEILVAACDIQEGQLIETEMLTVNGVLKENVLAGSFDANQKPRVIGQRADCTVKKNQQITEAILLHKDYSLAENLAPCVIPGELIWGISSSVRKGDTVKIYDGSGMLLLGEFRVAFAKDAANQEVVDLESPGEQKQILERTNSNTVLEHIEIEAEKDTYMAVMSAARETGGLLIIQKGD